MNCETALELLSASLDGELTPNQESQLQAHLDQCPSCRAIQAELIGLHTACGEMEVIPPAQLKERIMASLPAQRPSRVIYWRRWGAMAAALALVALAAWRLPHSLFDRSAPQVNESAVDAAGDTSGEIAAFSDAANGAYAGGSLFHGYGVMEDVAESGDDPDLAVPDLIGEVQHQLAAAAVTDDLDEATIENRFAAKNSAPTAGGGMKVARGSGETVAIAGMGDSMEPLDSPMAYSTFIAPQTPKTAPDDLVYAVDPGDTDMVLEAVPTQGEEPIAAQPFEGSVEDARDFSCYSAVITLTEGSFDGDYPRQLQENGDMWYLLPRSAVENAPQALDESFPSYELRLEGDDLTADAPYVLLVVPAAR